MAFLYDWNEKVGQQRYLLFFRFVLHTLVFSVLAIVDLFERFFPTPFV